MSGLTISFSRGLRIWHNDLKMGASFKVGATRLLQKSVCQCTTKQKLADSDAKFLVPDQEIQSTFAQGLLYRFFHLCSLACRYDKSMLESTISSNQGLRIWIVVLYFFWSWCTFLGQTIRTNRRRCNTIEIYRENAHRISFLC